MPCLLAAPAPEPAPDTGASARTPSPTPADPRIIAQLRARTLASLRRRAASRTPAHDPPRPTVPGSWLAQLRPGTTVRLGALDLTPITHPGPFAPAPMLMHEAMSERVLRIDEMRAPAVGRLDVCNTGSAPVLLMAGQIIAGGLQDRVMIEDAVLGAGARESVTVSCIEHLRWSAPVGATGFSATPEMLDPLRRRRITHTTPQGGADQGALWLSIDRVLARHRVPSRTASYRDVALRLRPHVLAMLDRVPRAPSQVGLMACLRGRLVALDLFGHSASWAAIAELLERSYLLASLDLLERRRQRRRPGTPHRGRHHQRHAPPARHQPDGWLASLVATRPVPRPGTGTSAAFSVTSAELFGAGLFHGDVPLHLAAFGN
ncbi:MAG: DUF6569 family protein [Gemmatimonadales bacterium]|nr:DUF6569 family protein [Gemmatimonadales bacterium]